MYISNEIKWVFILLGLTLYVEVNRFFDWYKM